jgi:hypothetical protein
MHTSGRKAKEAAAESYSTLMLAALITGHQLSEVGKSGITRERRG